MRQFSRFLVVTVQCLTAVIYFYATPAAHAQKQPAGCAKNLVTTAFYYDKDGRLLHTEKLPDITFRTVVALGNFPVPPLTDPISVVAFDGAMIGAGVNRWNVMKRETVYAIYYGLESGTQPSSNALAIPCGFEDVKGKFRALVEPPTPDVGSGEGGGGNFCSFPHVCHCRIGFCCCW